MTKNFTSLFRAFHFNSVIRSSALFSILLINILYYNSALADNKISNGTKIKIVSGTYAVSGNDFVINTGGNLSSNGILVLYKNLTNLNTSPDIVGSAIFKGNNPQTISGLNIFKNIAIDNASGVFLAGETNVTGTFTLTNGTVTLGNHSLVLGEEAAFSGTPSSSRMIICTESGELRKNFVSNFSGSFLFPVGDNTGIAEYSPVTLNFISGDIHAGNYIGVNLRNSRYEDPSIKDNYLNRYWNIRQSEIYNFTIDALFQYVPADVTGYENLVYCTKISPTPILTFDPANITNHQLSADALASFGTFTGGPLTAPSLTGPAEPCKDISGNVYTTDAGKTNYIWNFSSGGTKTAGGTSTSNTITITWNTPGPNNVSVTYDNASTTTVLNVNVIGPTISGRTEVCKLTTHTYKTQKLMSNYKWVFSGGILKGGGGTADSTIDIQWIVAGSRYVKVTYTNGTCTATNTLPVTVHLSSPSISGPSATCIGNQYKYSTDPGMTNYQWSCSSGGTIIQGGNNHKVTILWNVAGTQYVYCIYNSPYGCIITQTTFKVAVYNIPVPTISGNTNPNQGSLERYTTETGMNSYVWSVSDGGQIQSGGGATNYYADILWEGVGQQSVSVSYANPGRCAAASPAVLIVNVQGTGPSFPVNTQVNTGETGKITGISEFYNTNGMPEFTIYPVPNDGRFVLSISNQKTENYSIAIYNSLGAEVYTLKNLQVNGTHKQQIELNSAAEGVYNIIIKHDGIQISRRMLIKK